MRKKGLSQVVAMILIILIVIVAVSIIWVVVRPTIERGVERVGTEYITINMEIIGQSVFIDNDDVFFKVKRNPGKGNIIGLKVVLEDINGKEKLFDIEDFIIQELETREVSFNFGSTLEEIAKISIAPVFSSDGREVIGNVVDVYVVSGLEGGGNGGMNTTTCDFRLALQRKFATPEQAAELAPYCIGTNAMSMGSARIRCREDTLEEFLNVTQEEVLARVGNLNESLVPRNTTAYLLLNCEGPAHPNTWRDWNNDTETQNAIFNATKMRIDVFRGVLPNAIISLGPSPKGNSSERIEAFKRAGEFGVFDKVNCLEPRLFHRRGPDDGEFEDLLNLIETRVRSTLDGASAIKNSTGDPIEFCVTSSILIFNTNSLHHGQPVIPEFAQHQVDVVLEYDLVKLMNWWSGDFYDWAHPQLFGNMTLCDNQCQE